MFAKNNNTSSLKILLIQQIIYNMYRKYYPLWLNNILYVTISVSLSVCLFVGLLVGIPFAQMQLFCKLAMFVIYANVDLDFCGFNLYQRSLDLKHIVPNILLL